MTKNSIIPLGVRRAIYVTVGVLFATGLLVGFWHTLQPPMPQVRLVEIPIHASSRTYRLAIPPNAPDRPLPLVFAFHGAMCNAEQMARGSAWDRVAVEHGMIVVYPNAIRGLWAAPGVAPPAKIEADLALFDELIEQIDQQHKIDRSRIYMIGMSQGASYALHLAAVRSETIAAVAAHSHGPPRSVWSESPSRAVPIMLVVGDQDQQASTTTVKQAAEEYRAREYEVELVVVPELGHAWDRRQNGAIVRFLQSHTLRR